MDKSTVREILIKLTTKSFKTTDDIESAVYCAETALNAIYAPMTETQLWEIFAEVKECKKDKEDCSFNKCNSYVECDLLIQALLKKEGK